MSCFGKPPAELSHRVDEHVGLRIRLRRTLLGLTQERLAVALNMSYQQIQKYETGTNRVSAGRLFQLAQMLEVGVAFFFDGLDPSLIPQPLPHGGHNRVAIDLVRNFLEIGDESSRAAVAHLVKTLKEHLPARTEESALARDEEPIQITV